MSKLASRALLLRAAAIVAAIVVIVAIADYVFFVWLMPGVAPYTPIATLLMVTVIAPPFVLALMLQTEQVRQTQEHLAREQAARIAAEHMNAARSRFLANISHELRTPLNAIIGYSELMAETAEQEGRSQDVADHARVMAGGKRLLHLLNDLLDLAKVEAGRLSLTPGAFDVAEMLNEAVDMVRPEIERNRNRLVLDLGADIGVGHTDGFRLGQCVLNLMGNAAKFTSDGVITLTAKREMSGSAAWLSIIVEDTGIGIAPERQVLLFEPFMQAEVSGENPNAGPGLGLALTRQIAMLLGGGVTLESTHGKGSRFTLRVPLDAPAHASGDDAHDQSSESAAA